MRIDGPRGRPGVGCVVRRGLLPALARIAIALTVKID
jgi:hypothetical protein